jgi:hypothetical protein
MVDPYRRERLLAKGKAALDAGEKSVGKRMFFSDNRETCGRVGMAYLLAASHTAAVENP